jgi:predicted ABC-type ATPase
VKNKDKDHEDICNINALYNSTYQYFLPKKTLEKCMSSSVYTLQEQKDLQEDIRDIYRKTIVEQSTPLSSPRPIAIITAGIPGAGKTTILEHKLAKNRSPENLSIYISASDVCLKHQSRTYQKDLQNCNQSLNSRQEIYDKWKTGSYLSKHLILGRTIRDKKSFCLGTTCTEPTTKKFFAFLKKQGYEIKLLYVTASKTIGWKSIQERNKTFAHCRFRTKQGVKKMSLCLAQQIHAFLSFADEIEFYYRKGVHEKANLVANWTRNKVSSDPLGTLQIFSPKEYEKVKKIHSTNIKTLNRPDLDWESCLDKKSEILKKEEKHEFGKPVISSHQNSHPHFIGTNFDSSKSPKKRSASSL